MHHRDNRHREGADGAEQTFEWIVVAQRVASSPGKIGDVMASGPDVHARRGAEHDCAHVLGSQAMTSMSFPGEDATRWATTIHSKVCSAPSAPSRCRLSRLCMVRCGAERWT